MSASLMAPAEASAAALLPRCWRAVRLSLRILLGAVVAAWSLLLIAWLTLHWGILPHANDWRPQIEQRASAALGIPLRIGEIQVQSQSWIPTLELRDVRLFDRQQREALRLPRVSASVSLRSLLSLQLRFRQLLIDGAELQVRRDAAGRLHVGGLALDSTGSDGQAADWFFEQPEFVVRRGTLRWVDEQRGTPPLALTEVDLVLRNGLRRHHIRIDATPPADWGQRFSLRARMSQPLLGSRSGDWRRWSGMLHADLPQIDVAALRRQLDLPAGLEAGAGALRLWVDVQDGAPRGVTADLALRALALRWNPGDEPLQLQQAQGRLLAQRDAQGFSVEAQRLSFIAGDGLHWPAGDLRLALRRDAAGTVTGGELAAGRLDLALAARLAERLPQAAAWRQRLGALAPEGVLEGLIARWDGAPDALRSYQLTSRFSQLSLTGEPGRPGWRNATGELDATEKGGDARIRLDDGALRLPGLFELPDIDFDTLGARLDWRIDAAPTAGGRPGLQVQVHDLRFANPDAAGALQASWRRAAGASGPGVLDLAGTLERGDAGQVARYLPLALPEATRHYVRQAMLGGRLSDGEFRVQGDLTHFPFARARDGEFRIAARVDGADLAYVPDDVAAWPAFSGVAGELVFERNTMRIREAQARVHGVALSRVSGGIADFNQAVLQIEGQGRGPLADMLRYVNASPVGGWTGGALAQAAGTGPAELRLALALPLHALADSTVKGSLTLAGNDVRLRPELPLLGGARARIDFTQQGLTLSQGRARVLGGDASFEGGTQPDGSLRFNAQGTLSADGLQRAPELGALQRLATSFSGQTPYRLAVGVQRGHVEALFTSPLSGLGLDLPAPLGKRADASLPLRVETRLLPEVAGAPLRDHLRVELGSVVQALYLRDLSRATPQVLRGGIGVFDAAPQPDAGVAASVLLPQLDADAWQALAGTLGGTGGTSGAVGDADGYLPTRVNLRAKALVAGSRELSGVVLDARRSDAGWRARIDADQLAGDVELGPSRVYARLARLSLPPSQAASVESLLADAPASVPALDIVVEDFELGGKKLGRVEVDAVNVQRDWRLKKLRVSTPEATLSATGDWALPVGAARRRMQLDFTLQLRDSGALAERMGFGGVLKDGRGRLQGQVAWDGSPFALHVPSLGGQFSLALEDGQFLKAGPGVGRLLGVLSLQALPRRLTLDFRDLFGEGFAFDNVAGDVRIDQGVASTKHLRMQGVQAVVLMEGSADITRETQDLRVIVVPEINAGTASLAYAVINPAIGLGTFAAQYFLRRPLMATSTREFRITGPWADPKVERVERAVGEPLPDMVDPPEPASAAASTPPANP